MTKAIIIDGSYLMFKGARWRTGACLGARNACVDSNVNTERHGNTINFIFLIFFLVWIGFNCIWLQTGFVFYGLIMTGWKMMNDFLMIWVWHNLRVLICFTGFSKQLVLSEFLRRKFQNPPNFAHFKWNCDSTSLLLSSFLFFLFNTQSSSCFSVAIFYTHEWLIRTNK